MQIKSTLNVFNEASISVVPGPAGKGQILKRLAGTAEHPSESLAVASLRLNRERTRSCIGI